MLQASPSNGQGEPIPFLRLHGYDQICPSHLLTVLTKQMWQQLNAYYFLQTYFISRRFLLSFLIWAHFGISSFLMDRHNTGKHLNIFPKLLIIFLGDFGLHFTPFQHISEPHPKHNFQGYQPNKCQTNQNVQKISITQIMVKQFQR